MGAMNASHDDEDDDAEVCPDADASAFALSFLTAMSRDSERRIAFTTGVGPQESTRGG